MTFTTNEDVLKTAACEFGQALSTQPINIQLSRIAQVVIGQQQ